MDDRKIKMSNDNKVSEIRTSQSEPGQERSIVTFKASQWIWLLLGIVDALLALRMVLKLIAANPDSPIVAVIYSITALFLIPFVGLIASPTVGGMVLETATLFAIGVYALIAVALERLTWLIFYRPRGPVVGLTETTTSEHHSIP